MSIKYLFYSLLVIWPKHKISPQTPKKAFIDSQFICVPNTILIQDTIINGQSNTLSTPAVNDSTIH